jgi:hypothetical protein
LLVKVPLHRPKYDEARDHVKNIDADKTARNGAKSQVKQKYPQYSNGAHGIDVGPIRERLGYSRG